MFQTNSRRGLHIQSSGGEIAVHVRGDLDNDHVSILSSQHVLGC